MQQVTDITPLLQAVQSFGNWVLFFWLYMRERDRTTKVSEEHKSDLRKWAESFISHRSQTDVHPSQKETD